MRTAPFLLLSAVVALLAIASPAQGAENPAFREAADRAFHTLDPLDRRAFFTTRSVTGDDGIVVLRLFIPSGSAGGRYLEGDARGFSTWPRASSRAILTWDTRSGAMSMLVAGSCRSKYVPVKERCKQALPLKTVGWVEAWHRKDQKRYDNRIALQPYANGFDARISLLNPYTNGQSKAAWSVDFEIDVERAIDGRYRLEVVGNGYPALELLYFPRNGPRAAYTQARRPVQPGMLTKARKVVDPGGGLGAYDRESWNRCTQPSALTMRCQAYRFGGGWSASWSGAADQARP